jgi:hypothetical protein
MSKDSFWYLYIYILFKNFFDNFMFCKTVIFEIAFFRAKKSKYINQKKIKSKYIERLKNDIFNRVTFLKKKPLKVGCFLNPLKKYYFKNFF